MRPTDTGDVVSSFLEQNFPSYISDSFTAEMENELDEIASGERTYEKTLTDFYKPFHKDVKSKEKIEKLTNLGLADPKFKCPKCGKTPMEIKLGKNGKFLSCTRYPDCDGALTIDGTEYKSDTPIGTDPASGLPIFVLNGKYGPYVQLGLKPEKPKKGEPKSDKPKPLKPKMASIPKTMDPMKVTIPDALKYLSLPKSLGVDPNTGNQIIVSIGRFGPYVRNGDDFRSIKVPDDVYSITFERAVELLAQPKRQKGFARKKKPEVAA